MNSLPNEKGFTLVEALVATVILSIGIFTLMTMQTVTIKGNAHARGITTASTWAQDRIEQLMSTDYDTLGNGSATSPDGHYSLKWTVLPDNPVPNVKRITVTITYTTLNGKRSFIYKTMNFKPLNS